ncbi:MAG: hypothetical protein HY810_01235 [Candidatus Omnitrophica bacterium]|nr:hypothetical protein [Candidatus Omnitrophota bacterium]
MRYWKVFIVGVLLLISPGLVFAGQRIKRGRSSEIKAEKILDNILFGFKLDDYNIYARDFDPALKISGARTKFYHVNRYINRVLGSYVTREYMGSLRKGDIIIVLWKGIFDKSEEDVLIKLVMQKKNSRYYVTGLLLQ